MSLTSTVLFQQPQQEIASLIVSRIEASSATSIITGFVTPGGLGLIQSALLSRPMRLGDLVIGAATYPAFEALDNLISAGISAARLRIHLGHTYLTGGRKNPFARYHPMLHSKVYYMELPADKACAFIGSHNVTSFALGGSNGEASVMLEGPRDSSEFAKIREHIKIATNQAVPYDPALKEAFAWWSREFIEGLKVEIGLPQNWTADRTILIFATADQRNRPRANDHIYFEIPEGIAIESLKTEVHLFLFSTLPSSPSQALASAPSADAHFTCRTLGAENRQGNLEVAANWRIETTPFPVLTPVPSSQYRPSPPRGMQQVRAEVRGSSVQPFEYLFERERAGWDPLFSDHDQVSQPREILDRAMAQPKGSEAAAKVSRLVVGLTPRTGAAKENDEAALKLAAPESGSFVLVSVRRRKRDAD